MVTIPAFCMNYKDSSFTNYLGNDPKGTGLIFPRALVWVEGEECPVRLCRVSAIPFNRMWPGKQRELSQSEESGFCLFSADGPVKLRVQWDEPIATAVLRPLSKGVKVEQTGEKTVEFTLPARGGYVLELNGQHHPLHLIFDPIKPLPPKDEVTRYFGPGVHFEGIIPVKDHDRIFVHPEATVYGSFFTQGAEDVHIFGGGVVDGGTENRLYEHCYEPFTKGTLRFYNSRNVVIEDVVLKDSASWVLSLFDCDNVRIHNVKALGHWRYNTDGIDVVNSCNVSITNCFLHVFDDAVTIKGIYNCPRVLENIRVEDCVMWCSWGRTLEVGVETDAVKMRNITFSRCDCIRNAHAVLDARSGGGADVEDVLFENCTVEYQKDFLRPLYQYTEDSVYDPALSKYPVPTLFHVDNKSFFEGRQGNLRRVRAKDLFVYCEEDCLPPKIVAKNYFPQAILEDITMENVYINGVKQKDLSAFQCDFEGGASVELRGEL